MTPILHDPNLGDLTIDFCLDGTGWTGSTRNAEVVSGNLAPNVALGSRICGTAGLAATTGTIGLNHSSIREFTCVLAVGLHASFRALVTYGSQPLSVDFRLLDHRQLVNRTTGAGARSLIVRGGNYAATGGKRCCAASDSSRTGASCAQQSSCSAARSASRPN